MLSSGWFASMHARFSSTELANFFFEPVQLHLQFADLLVQHGFPRLVIDLASCTIPAERCLRVRQQLLLPLAHLRRMDIERAGQLGHGPISLERRQSHLGLERITMPLPLGSHPCSSQKGSLVQARFYLNLWSTFRGP